MKRAFIFAAGPIKYDVGFTEPAHMWRINWEPLLRRVARQLKEREIDVVLVANQVAPYAEGIPGIVKPDGPTFHDSIYATVPYWAEENIGILGDVAFTEPAMDTVHLTSGFKFFGRKGGSKLTGGGAEIFAWKWTQDDADTLLWCMKNAVKPVPNSQAIHKYPVGGLHGIYRALNGLDSDDYMVYEDYWYEINDGTDDIDCPWQANRLARVWERHGIK